MTTMTNDAANRAPSCVSCCIVELSEFAVNMISIKQSRVTLAGFYEGRFKSPQIGDEGMMVDFFKYRRTCELIITLKKLRHLNRPSS